MVNLELELNSNPIVGGLLPNTPAAIYYFPNFISRTEAETILTKVYRVPKPKWVTLKDRRLQNWGGLPSPTTGRMVGEPLPLWLETLSQKIYQHLFTSLDSTSVPYLPLMFDQFNHALVNEYLPGQGIFVIAYLALPFIYWSLILSLGS